MVTISRSDTEQGRSLFATELLAAAASSGLKGIVEILAKEISAQCAVFDGAGNTLAVFPERSMFDFASALDAVNPSRTSAIYAKKIEMQGELVAILAMGKQPREFVKEITTSTIQLELGKLRARLEGRRELIGHMFDDVLNQRASDPEVENRFTALGLDIRKPFRVLVRNVKDDFSRLSFDEVNLQAAISGTEEHLIRFRRGGALVILLSDSPIVPLVASNLLIRDDAGNPISSVGVSRPHVGTPGLRAAYFEAYSAAESGVGVNEPSRVSPSQTVLLMNPRADLESMAEEYLAPLFRNANSDGHLFETLSTYLECGRSGGKAAEVLFIHRNTLRYRLTQIEELLNVSLESTEDIVDLWLVVKMHRKTSAQKGIDND